MLLDRAQHEYPLMLRDLPSDDKPREKLLAQGPEVLTMRELTALLLVTGTVKDDVLGMASRIVRDYGERNIFAERDAGKLSRDLDLPIVKACTIIAAGEIFRRMSARAGAGFPTIRSAKDAYEYLSDMRNLPREQLRGLYLNGHNRIIRDEVISVGTVNANIVHAREVFRTAIECNAVAVVLAHNHPSGEVTPSAEDVAVTRKLIEAGELIGIHLLDHVIITKDAFASVSAEL
jgi:DNA repair protein RadC